MILKAWPRSRGLVIGGALVIMAMIVIAIGIGLNPHGDYAVLAGQFFWGLAGVFVGLNIATDALTRSKR